MASHGRWARRTPIGRRRTHHRPPPRKMRSARSHGDRADLSAPASDTGLYGKVYQDGDELPAPYGPNIQKWHVTCWQYDDPGIGAALPALTARSTLTLSEVN